MKGYARVLAVVTLVAMCGVALAEEQKPPPQTVESAYPGLVGGALASAAVGVLEPGILLDMGEEKVAQQQVDEILAAAPKELQEKLRKNSLLIVQEIATKGLLLRAARKGADQKAESGAGKADGDVVRADEAEAKLISDHLQGVVSDVKVSDAEITLFYEDNRDMFGDSSLEAIRDALGPFVLKTKRQEKVDSYIRGLSGTFGVVISGPWLAEQAVLVRDNPVDKARANGLPTMADFGADGCQPCEMMRPILEKLTKDYTGRANVLFVHVRQDPVLATRFGIQSIPTQVFFGKDGIEVSRHTGFLSQGKIEQKLADLGAK